MGFGLLALLGLAGTAMDLSNNHKVNKDIKRVGGNPVFMNCYTVDDFIRQKIIWSQYPLTMEEKARMEEMARTRSDTLSRSFYRLYFDNFGKSLSDVVGVMGNRDEYIGKTKDV